MPVINLKLSGQQDPALAKQIVLEISRLTKEVLNKKPELTVVIVEFVPDYLWYVDSVPLADLDTRSFQLTIRITDSTNLKGEKATYIHAVHASLTSLLETLHPVSYTAIHDMKADGYGYDGLTIEYTYVHNQRK